MCSGSQGAWRIQPSQADYWQATRAGHGECMLEFAPSSIQEMVDMVLDAYDLADCYRVPAMILADGMLGQMMELVCIPGERSSSMTRGPGPPAIRISARITFTNSCTSAG